MSIISQKEEMEGKDLLTSRYEIRILSVMHDYDNQIFCVKMIQDLKSHETEQVNLRKNFLEFSVPYSTVCQQEERIVEFEICSDSVGKKIVKNDDDEDGQTTDNLRYNLKLDLSKFSVRDFKYRAVCCPSETSEIHFRIVLRGKYGKSPEESYPFYRLFHPEYQFFPIIQRILTFVTHLDLFSQVSLISKYFRKIVRKEFILDLDLSYHKEQSLDLIFPSLFRFQVIRLILRDLHPQSSKIFTKPSVEESNISRTLHLLTSDMSEKRRKKSIEEEEEEDISSSSSVEEEEESEELQKRRRRRKTTIFRTLRTLCLLDENFEFDISFVQELLSAFPSLENLELEGIFKGKIRLRSDPRISELQERFPQLSLLIQSMQEEEEEEEEENEKDDSEQKQQQSEEQEEEDCKEDTITLTPTLEEEPQPPQQPQDPRMEMMNLLQTMIRRNEERKKNPIRKKTKKNSRIYPEHNSLLSFSFHLKKTPIPPRPNPLHSSPEEIREFRVSYQKSQAEKQRNTQHLILKILQRCPNCDFLGVGVLTGMKLLMVPSPVRQLLFNRREEMKKKFSREVNLRYDLNFRKDDEGFMSQDLNTHRKVFFLNGCLWMLGIMLKNDKNPLSDLMSAGLLSFDSVNAIQASNVIRIDDTIRTCNGWFSPQARQMYSVHLTDRMNRRFIDVGIKLCVNDVIKSLSYRDICFSAAKRAEDKRADIQAREDSVTICIRKDESHKEGPIIVFGLEWSYKFYRTKGKVNRASFYITRNFGGRITVPMRYRLYIEGTDFDIQSCMTNYQIHKGWGYTDLFLPDTEDEIDEFKVDMKIGEHVMTHEEYTMHSREILRKIKVGDTETKEVIIPVDHLYSSVQYPLEPIIINNLPLCLEFYPLGYYGNTKSVALGICHHIEIYELKAKYTIEVGGCQEVRIDNKVETIFQNLCPVDEEKKEWAFKITVEVLEIREKPIDLPF